MHRHRNSHGIGRSLTERRRAAAHEKSACETGREPETFHDSDELTNFAAAAQQNVRECPLQQKLKQPPPFGRKTERRLIPNSAKDFY